MAEVLDKPFMFTRGLKTARREELIGPFSLPGVPDEGEFREAWNVIRNLQWTTSAEPLSLAKEAAKVSKGSPKKSTTTPSGKAPETSKDSKKRF